MAPLAADGSWGILTPTMPDPDDGPETAAGRTAGPPTLVDCDVHPLVNNAIGDVLPYMDRAWRRRFELKGEATLDGFISYRFTNVHAGHGLRPEAVPPGGGAPASDPEYLAAHHLDAGGIDVAILNNLQIMMLATVQAGPDESLVLCRAYNDFFLENWVPVDDRFRLGIVVSPHDPVRSAEEIRRVGGHPRVVAVYLPQIWTGLGSRHFDPIYAAATEHDLPVVVHPTTNEFSHQGTTVNPTGYPECYTESYANFPLVGWGHLSSLIFSGAFERFPGLRVAIVELGSMWAGPALWRLDKAWQSNRIEVPWVRRRPSEYAREHVRFGTQPLDEPPDREDLHALVRILGHEKLIFCSDYPHWDGDDARGLLAGLDPQHRADILANNAVDFFRLS